MLAVGWAPREGDNNRNQAEHDNLGLGIIQWYSVNLKWKNRYGGWYLVCVDAIISIRVR